MRNKLIFSIILLTITFQGFSSDKSEVWSRMYKRSILPELKYSVMLNIVELNDREMIPLLEEILTEDIIANLNNKRGVTEESTFIELTKLIVKELGELKAKSSASLVYTIATETDDPLLKAEAIIALGNMRADAYVDDVAFILKNLNLRPVEGKSTELENEAKIAYGSISALDKFKNIEGYSPVFFASLGWYDQRIRNFANMVLKTIVDNPIDALIPIITEGSFYEKEKAILEVASCSAPAEDKAKAAREAMKQGFDNSAATIKDGMVLTSLRKNAIKVLYSTKSSHIDDVYYLSQSVRSGTDLEEKIYAIRTLGINGSDEAIGTLSSLLSEFNERSMSGLDITYADEDVIGEMIATLGKSGNQIASGVLTEAQFSGYSGGIVRQAKAAIENLN